MGLSILEILSGALATFALLNLIYWLIQRRSSPFAYDGRKKRKTYITDQKKRAEVLKQQFSIEKVPEKVDAIIIGAGVGGLVTGSILARAGKKVLILEQHDQAGGGTHTFIEKGYEFDPGVHYIGELEEGTFFRNMFDQVTEGQLEWALLDKNYDRVSIGVGDEKRHYEVPRGDGGNAWKHLLKKQFPDEHEAIDKYFSKLDEHRPNVWVGGILKMVPLWFSWILIKTGLVHLMTTSFTSQYAKSALDVVSELTDNQDLKTMMTYLWLDIGTRPSRAHFPIYSMIINHYRIGGASYPVGGASEFGMSLIPIIERGGGRVLVRATIEEILHNGKRVSGVRVRKGATDLVYELNAPMVISSAGMYNTFNKLLPKHVASKSVYYPLADYIQPSFATIQGFIGMNASNEELNLKAENVFAYVKNDCGESHHTEFMDLPREEAMQKRIPMVFIASPSAKNPMWAKDPERKNKSTMTIFTGVPWEWFQEFDGSGLHKRGDKYEEIKARLGQSMLDLVLEVYPQIKHHIDYIDYGTPLTNNHYLGVNFGETYGLSCNRERFNDPWLWSRMRPKSDIPGLYLSGQDNFGPGLMPGVYGGVMTACSVLDRNLFIDLLLLHFNTNMKKQQYAKAKSL